MRTEAASSISSVVTILLIVILLVQCFVGLDLTDEIQYYYQIEGLLKTGKLFSNDLFIQQIIYLLFYPILKPYHLMFGQVGLVLFGRIVYALLLLAVYAFCRHQFLRAGANKLASGCCAAALVLAPAYHGVFAISYNTISQIGWILATVFVAFRLPTSAFMWGATITISGLAHPPGGIAIALVCAVHLLERKQIGKLLRTLLITLFFSTVMLGLIVVFAEGVRVLERALAFTSGFSVGSALLHMPTVRSLCWIGILVLLASFLPAPRKVGRFATSLLIVLTLVCVLYQMASSIEQFDGKTWPYRYTQDVLQRWVMLCVVALYALRCHQSGTGSTLPGVRSLALISFFQAIVLAGTSSNGIVQANGAFSILLPIAIAGIAIANRHDSVWLVRLPAVASAILAATLTLSLPYRQDPLFKTDRTTSDIPMFAGLLLTIEQVKFFEEIRDQIAQDITEPGGLLLSSTPGLYPILDLTPQTCMIYNHSLGSSVSEDALTKCLLERDIQLVAHLRWTKINPSTLKFDALTARISSESNLTCKTKTINLEFRPKGLPSNPTLSICN